jgi:hypothetical protein
MKKIIYIAILALCTMASVTSCTEQEVKPQEGGGGGIGTDPKG